MVLGLLSWPCCCIWGLPRCNAGLAILLVKVSASIVARAAIATSVTASVRKRQRILLTCNEPELAALPSRHNVPVLVDRGLYIGSECSF